VEKELNGVGGTRVTEARSVGPGDTFAQGGTGDKVRALRLSGKEKPEVDRLSGSTATGGLKRGWVP